MLLSALMAAVVASLLLAPMSQASGCASSAVSADPSCQTFPARTLIGFEANPWLWAAVLLVIAVVTVWVLRHGKSKR